MANSTIAPSEKHLEDWIVANPKRFFEDVRISYGRRFVGRQYVLSSGIVDLIVAGKLGLRAIELKKGHVDGNAVSQVIRYMGELSYLFAYVHYKFLELNDPYWDKLHLVPDDAYPEVCGILIGHSFDEMALRACLTNQIYAYQYEYTDGEYSFEEVSTSLDIECGNILNSDLGMAMKEVIRHRRLFLEDRDTLIRIYQEEGLT